MMRSGPSLSCYFRWLTGLWMAWLLALAGAPALAADDFLPPEKAFQFDARVAAPGQLEVRFAIAPGYYLYRERLSFAADGATLGEPTMPTGKVKFDENFQKNVETYRNELRVAIPVASATGPFQLKVVSQGCADAGLCYPPMTSVARLDAAVVSAPPPAAAKAVTASWADGSIVEDVLRSGRFWSVVGVFLGMGLLLSLTPCVLPMLPILSSIIVGTQDKPSRMRGLALAASYALGMAMVYTGLGVAAGLAGEGLAATLQTPWMIGAFALLLAAFSLSMFDVYELRLPARFTTQMHSRCNRMRAGQIAGVFMMGGLSAFIVSPCVSAPLAGALLFISQTRDVVLGGSALFSMAAGMSVPLLILGVSSGRWLPAAGPWMTAVKRLFGVLMLGVAIWIAQPVLPSSLVLALWGLLLLVLGFMLRPFHSAHHRGTRRWLQPVIGVAALAMGLMQLVGAASGGHDPLQPLAHLGSADSEAQSRAPAFRTVRSVAELDAALASAGRPVMLDFYADWCVSCKEMERFTFSNPRVAARLGNALLLKADVTANSPNDRELLRRFKLFGPPGTLFFDASGQEVASARVVGFQGPKRFGGALDSAGL
ncbi:MAG: protein-disulfide reductase DsbD [Burkholderiales bacterium]|nr:protein-disulfide reductase DsbD [Burkholderiales bacterium]